MEIIHNQPDLSATEWGIVLELLERERAALPGEIHHTATRKLREELRDRLTTIDEIVRKIEAAAPQLADSGWAAKANC